MEETDVHVDTSRMAALEKALFDIYLWRTSSQDFFTIQLYKLFQKADAQNKLKLARGFPVEAQAFTMWHTAPNEADFLRDIKEKARKV